MEQVVIYALGTGGDIDPMVALGIELMRRGYRVSFLTNDYFQARVSAAGLEFISVGTLEQYHLGNSVTAWESRNHVDNFEHYHAPAFEPAFNFVKSLVGKNVLVLALGEENGAAAAAEKFRLPYVKMLLSPNIVFSAYSPPAPMKWAIPKRIPRFIVRFLLRRNRKTRFKVFCRMEHTQAYLATRQRLGCSLTFQTQSNAVLQLGFFPEWFGMPAKDWPTNLKLVGFPLQNRASNQSRNELDRFIEQQGAPLIFTSGTGVKDVVELFTEGRKICEQLQVPGVFVGGASGAEILQGSSLCLHLDYIDFEHALSKALAIVHHGGMGTTAQAIKAGIPQLIRPIKYDQPDNADRIYKLGLGTYVMPEQFKAEVVAPMIGNMLQKAKSSKALRFYAEDVNNSRAIVDACDVIERELKIKPVSLVGEAAVHS
ncbi:glycosyltransferase [Cellvibrio sp. KY-GH-1]|uniref:glycosyltransferase n=1 Tax=Cellvibrio sp. KY-GH-1 TaxID=2303332 RepID=UPI00124522A6|nr:nucleotide disphospho-sugar-binding domain-containing protein [Cellvibrio sp. KY-GH-1]QEY17124.1 glycosyltransferase [Cellvibrio sp. KY-GH-1]